MTSFRIALANLRIPDSAAESVRLAEEAIAEAASQGARLICFPECYVPGYRTPSKPLPPPDARFLDSAAQSISAAAALANIAVILGTERITPAGLLISALVLAPDGSTLGFQDKVQLDPSEEPTYTHGSTRKMFQTGPLRFGIAICHEGWRYPETVRWAACRGAHAVFHPHFHLAEPGAFVPNSFAHPDNTFHEKAILCRAAENTCYFASVNCASPGSPTTSAVARPDGSLLYSQPYGQPGILLADLELDSATGLLARRFKPVKPPDS